MQWCFLVWSGVGVHRDRVGMCMVAVRVYLVWTGWGWGVQGISWAVLGCTKVRLGV